VISPAALRLISALRRLSLRGCFAGRHRAEYGEPGDRGRGKTGQPPPAAFF
jgi:hypothetical protein